MAERGFKSSPDWSGNPFYVGFAIFATRSKKIGAESGTKKYKIKLLTIKYLKQKEKTRGKFTPAFRSNAVLPTHQRQCCETA